MDDCIEWTGRINKNGYGTVYKLNKTWMAHRWAFFEATGVDPGKGFVCHKCDNKKCVNPDHLYLGNAKTNMQDRMEREVHPNGLRKKYYCPNGHKYTKHTVAIKTYKKAGYKGRKCKECNRLGMRRLRRKWKNKEGVQLEWVV